MTAKKYTLETRTGKKTFSSSMELHKYAGENGISTMRTDTYTWRRVYADSPNADSYYKSPEEVKKRYSRETKPIIEKHLKKGDKMTTKQTTLGGELPKKKKVSSTATKKKGTVKVKAKKAKVKARTPSQTQHVRDYWRRPPR